MSRDLTAALEERRNAKAPKSLTLLGRTFELPRGLPAASAVKMIELERQGVTDADPTFVVELGREILGDAQWDELLAMIDFDELDLVFEAIMSEVMGAPQSGGGDGPGEAQDGPSVTSSESTGEPSKPTSPANTGSTPSLSSTG